MRYTFIASFLSLFFVYSAVAQENNTFTRLGEKEGIYQSIIYELAQDSLGNVWAATEEGVLRFNSRKSSTYNNYKGLPAGLRNRITATLIGENGKLLVGTEETILLYDTEKDAFVEIIEKGKKSPTLVRSIISGRENEFWIGGFNGVWRLRFNGTSVESIEQFLPEKRVQSLLLTGNLLLVGTERGMTAINADNGQAAPLAVKEETANYFFREIQEYPGGYLIGTEKDGLFFLSSDFRRFEKVNIEGFPQESATIREILPDLKGNVYIATDGFGLLHLSPDFKLLNNYKNDINNPESISGNGIYDLLIGKEGILWVATYGGGLNKKKLADNPFTNITHRINDRNSIAENFVRAITEDSEGNLWFGRKGGVSVKNTKTNQWKHFNLPAGVSSVPVLCFAEDGEYMWAGTYGRGAFKIKKADFKLVKYVVLFRTEKVKSYLEVKRVYTASQMVN